MKTFFSLWYETDKIYELDQKLIKLLLEQYFQTHLFITFWILIFLIPN